jgi:hypothetical protein
MLRDGTSAKSSAGVEPEDGHSEEMSERVTLAKKHVCFHRGKREKMMLKA